MSESDDRPLVVARGRFPLGVALPAAFLGLVLPAGMILASFFASRQEALQGLFPWHAQIARLVGNGVVPVLSIVAGFVTSVCVLVFIERRTGTVRLHAERVVWEDGNRIVLWREIEGFRDTPHPWVELVFRNGAAWTIPTPTEPQRERLLEVLATKLPNLALPFEERQRP